MYIYTYRLCPCLNFLCTKQLTTEVVGDAQQIITKKKQQQWNELAFVVLLSAINERPTTTTVSAVLALPWEQH